MVSRNQLTRTKGIQQRTGSNFHFATRLLPQRIRHGTYVLYAFFRVADEVVDDPDAAPPDQQRAELDRIEDAVLGEEPPDDEVLAAFREVKAEHDIPDREVEVFLDAMRMDIDTDDYADHDELADYLRGSSVAVGNMMTALMEPDDPEAARPHAKALGEAFQLTNFLRDVREDVVEFDRVYLPRSTLAEHGTSPDAVRQLEDDPAIREAVRAELRRTERLYHEGVAGIEYLPADCQFGVLLAAVIYADHHRLVRNLDCAVVTERPTLTKRRRVVLGLRTWWHWRRTGDPVETFYAAGSVDPPAEADVEGDHGGSRLGPAAWPARALARSARGVARVLRARVPR